MNQVIDVLSSTQSAASETTHALKLLGKGNMRKGIRAIYTNGVVTGGLIGGGTVAVVCGLVFYIVYKKQAISCEDANVTSDEEVIK